MSGHRPNEEGDPQADPRAICASHDPETWFPESAVYEPLAVAMCRRCPLIRACADYALDNEERFGVWGGLTPRERASIHRRAARKRAAGRREGADLDADILAARQAAARGEDHDHTDDGEVA